MKKDLHDSFKYQTPEIENILDVTQDNIGNNRKLSKNTFHFPECQIRYKKRVNWKVFHEFTLIKFEFFSNSAQEILNLVNEILEEACYCSKKYVPRLFYTSRNIFEMYAYLVPEMHKSFLETIPQQVGKCMIG